MGKSFKVSIVGQGYVGLPLSLAAIRAGHSVTGIEVDLNRLSQLASGRSTIEDISDEQLSSCLQSGLKFEGNFQSVTSAEIVIICVPTPIDEFGAPNLEPLVSCVNQVADLVKPGTLIVNESTSFPGTVRELIEPTINKKSGVRDLYFVSAPERVDPGNAKWNITNTPRLIGGINQKSTDLARQFYESFCSEVITVSSPEVAETAKLLENTFRQVNIALINQIAEFTRPMGIDALEVVNAASSKPYGFLAFMPGAGVGGHCIPVDPMYLAWRAEQFGVELPLVRLAQELNSNRPKKIVSSILEKHGSKPSSVLVVGIGYKAGSSDIRESSGVKIYNELKSLVRIVDWFDPFILTFDGKNSQGDWTSHEIVILVQDCGGFKIENWQESSKQIYDCTGKYFDYDFVRQV
jgi:UDP-N-acetyl-D-glucosamine dehydrogenase